MKIPEQTSQILTRMEPTQHTVHSYAYLLICILLLTCVTMMMLLTSQLVFVLLISWQSIDAMTKHDMFMSWHASQYPDSKSDRV